MGREAGVNEGLAIGGSEAVAQMESVKSTPAETSGSDGDMSAFVFAHGGEEGFNSGHVDAVAIVVGERYEAT